MKFYHYQQNFQLSFDNQIFQRKIRRGRFSSFEKVNGWYQGGKNMYLLMNMFETVAFPYNFLKYRYGYRAYFYYTAIKADYSLYLNYLENVCGNDCARISKCGFMLDGIFCSMCLFLRSDLMDDYIHYNDNNALCNQALESLWYLIEPNVLLRYQEKLTKNGIPLSKQNEYEMNLFKNPRYHPFNRIMVIRKLCFSSKFCVSWIWDHHESRMKIIYTRIRKKIVDLYDHFNCFQCEYHLNEYDEYKNDVPKQQELHDEFKVVIQVLLDFSCFWFQNQGNGHELCQQYHRNKSKN